MRSTRRTLIALLIASGVMTGIVNGLRTPTAVATEETPFTQLRQTLRTFQTLRMAVTYLSPQRMAARERGENHVCDLHEPRLECADGGVFTLLSDGRVAWDAGLEGPVRRILIQPPNIYRYYVASFVNPTPDSPVAFIPYFEAAFAVLRSGFGEAPAITGTADEFDHYSELKDDVLWYRVPVAHPSFGEAEVFTALDDDGGLLEVDFVHVTGLHRFVVGDALLVDFELEPRWFDHNLTKLRLPFLSSRGIPDTGDGLPDGRAKVIE